MAYHCPHPEENIDTRRELIAASRRRPFIVVPTVDLKQGKRYDENTENGMEIVLRRSSDTIFLFDIVDKRPKQALHDVKDENGNAPTL